MKILAVADEECAGLWDYYVPGRLREYDLILSSGDLQAEYLSFLVTMARCPVLYVHGNHDGCYRQSPPEGCDCIDDRLVVYNGLRILGLGGCRKYHPGAHQYTERQMRRRIRRLRWALWRSKGVDIVVTHAPPRGIGDADDPAHWGFQALLELLDKYNPQYLLHGHVHPRYGGSQLRERAYGSTQIINVVQRYTLEIPDREIPEKERGQLLWKNKPPKQEED
ncbi:MAG TPA: metallophosphoesterase [Candidatus Faecousia intestinigallinarum]|nr:metallophosphoesterase [Candidatus Faecousia intestinigallinarum]